MIYCLYKAVYLPDGDSNLLHYLAIDSEPYTKVYSIVMIEIAIRILQQNSKFLSASLIILWKANTYYSAAPAKLFLSSVRNHHLNFREDPNTFIFVTLMTYLYGDSIFRFFDFWIYFCFDENWYVRVHRTRFWIADIEFELKKNSEILGFRKKIKILFESMVNAN